MNVLRMAKCTFVSCLGHKELDTFKVIHLKDVSSGKQFHEHRFVIN